MARELWLLKKDARLAHGLEYLLIAATSLRLYGQHYQEIPEDEKKGYNAKPVSIGKYTYVGAGARIMPGVRVGKGVIISSNAIVTKHVRDFSVISGINNVVGDTRDVDKPYLDDLQLLKSYEEWQKK